MKGLLKSRAVTIIVTACVCIVGTAYAAVSILASNIKYTPSDNSWKKANGDNITNVKEAIDELYTKTNSDFSVVLLSENYNSGSNGMATLRTTEFSKKYKYIKLTNLYKPNSSVTCELGYYKSGGSYYTDITTDQKYSLSMLDYFYIKSKGGVCGINIIFSNTSE